VQRDERVSAGFDPEAAVDVGSLQQRPQPHQRVDHRVADEMDALGRDALAEEVLLGFGAVREAPGRDLVDEYAVDLLGHRPVEAPQAGLDVRHGNVELDGRERPGQSRVDVADHDHELGPLGEQHLLDPLEAAARLRPVAAGADAEEMIGPGEIELTDEDVRHLVVVVLARVDDGLGQVGDARLQRMEDRRGLHEVGPRSDDVQDVRHSGSCGKPVRSDSTAASVARVERR
jgi:hypothetical protein